MNKLLTLAILIAMHVPVLSQEDMSKYGKHHQIWDNSTIESVGDINIGTFFNLADMVSGIDQNSTLASINGILINHEYLKNKIVVIDFWYIRCAPCMRQLPALDALRKIYSDNDIVILSLSRDDPKSILDHGLDSNDNIHIIPDIHPHLADGSDFRYPFKALTDPKGKLIYSLLGAKKTPTPIKTMVEDFAPKIDLLKELFFLP